MKRIMVISPASLILVGCSEAEAMGTILVVLGGIVFCGAILMAKHNAADPENHDNNK